MSKNESGRARADKKTSPFFKKSEVTRINNYVGETSNSSNGDESPVVKAARIQARAIIVGAMIGGLCGIIGTMILALTNL